MVILTLNTFTFKKSEAFKYFNPNIPESIVTYNEALSTSALMSNKYIRSIIYEKIISKNELNNHIFLYDNKISKTILFSLSNNKQYRKIIENCLGKHFEFIIVRAEDEILILINIGINIYQLVFSTFKKYHLNMALYTFFKKCKGVFIDVTNYQHFFNFTLKYHLFDLSNPHDNLILDNIFFQESLNCNWLDKFINKKGVLFKCQDEYFLDCKVKHFKKLYYQKKSGTKCYVCYKENLIKSNVEYKYTDLISFYKATKKVYYFKKFNARKDLESFKTFNGYCIAIEKDNQIIAGACLEKIGLNYIYISYIFVIDEYQSQGYGTQILKAIDNECLRLKKKPLLISYNHLALAIYEKHGYVLHQEITCPDIN